MGKSVYTTSAILFVFFTSFSFAHTQTENHKHENTYSAKFTSLGEGKPTLYSGRPIYHHVRTADLPSEVALFEEILPAKSLGAPPHSHQNEDEIFIVLEGKVHFLDNENEVIADAGTIASLPRKNLHGFWNPYDEPAKLLVFVSPGHFSEFFETVASAVETSKATTPEEVGAIIGKEAASYGVDIDMSVLPKSAMALLKPAP